jgi:hypothetical protein
MNRLGLGYIFKESGVDKLTQKNGANIFFLFA